MDYNKFLRFVSRRLIVLGVAMCMFPIANCMAQGAKEKNAGVVESPVPAKLTIVGRVTDSAGEPLAGASVIVKGSSTGVSTDTDGTFTLRFTKNKTKDNIIVVSFIGIAVTGNCD
ncbi:MAG: carboxypeptidase-like regulatory domain-containing protein [Candidatus Cryptobacteroides sp.]